MDLYKIIPQSKEWVISNNIVYVNYIVKTPILVKDGQDIWVYFDNKIAKHIIKILKILQKENIPFLFKSTFIFFDHKFTSDEIHTINLKQYITNVCNEVFFDGFQKIGFDYIKNISLYLTKYECYDIFKEVYDQEKKKALSKSLDYWTNKMYYNIPREDIRDYISSLDRDIKISLIF